MPEHEPNCICQNCKKPFYRCQSLIKSGRGKHCSQKCAEMNRPRKTLLARLKEYTGKQEPSGCILFVGTIDPSGYGRISCGRRMRLAHRVAYEFAFGKIPDELCVCHRCDVRNCINPQHLFLGTQADNMRDRMIKGRAPKGESHWQKVLTEADVTEIRCRRDAGETCQSIADAFSISDSMVSMIYNRKRWRDFNPVSA